MEHIRTTQAATLCDSLLGQAGAKTQYLYCYKNPLGLDFALERKASGSLFAWLPLKPPAIDGIAIRNSKNPGQPYSPNQPRNSNLNAKNAPGLRKGKTAWYIAADDMAAFKQLVEWFVKIING